VSARNAASPNNLAKAQWSWCPLSCAFSRFPRRSWGV